MASGTLALSPGVRNSITTAQPALQVATHSPGGQLQSGELGLEPSAVMSKGQPRTACGLVSGPAGMPTREVRTEVALQVTQTL